MNAPPQLHGPGLTDVRMMIVAHTSMRRELGLSPRAIRSVRPGDQKRAGLIGEHVLLFTSLLHHHHSSEDELLWDVLLERVPNELAPLVHLMESQHEIVAGLLEHVDPAVHRWRRSASSTDGEALAVLLTHLVGALAEHLHAEETHLLPIMARHITAAEWEVFSERGMAAIPRRLLFLGFGMMTYEGDPAVLALEMKKVPAPVRALLPVLGRRSFRRYARRIHGTPIPPRGVGTLTSIS